jgi:hypothetical protein
VKVENWTVKIEGPDGVKLVVLPLEQVKYFNGENDDDPYFNGEKNDDPYVTAAWLAWCELWRS